MPICPQVLDSHILQISREHSDPCTVDIIHDDGVPVGGGNEARRYELAWSSSHPAPTRHLASEDIVEEDLTATVIHNEDPTLRKVPNTNDPHERAGGMLLRPQHQIGNGIKRPANGRKGLFRRGQGHQDPGAVELDESLE